MFQIQQSSIVYLTIIPIPSHSHLHRYPEEIQPKSPGGLWCLFSIGGIKSNNISNLKRNGFKKVALVSELMNSEDPKEDAMMILKKLSHEN